MRVLVAHASKHGGTEGLAQWVGEALEHHGIDAVVIPANSVTEIDTYDAVVVGGALYIFRWHADARRFVKRYETVLRAKPVWLFSSGPLDDSAMEKEIPPVRSAQKAMDRVGARGHMTFGGRMLSETNAKLPVGDWRNRTQVDGWVKKIVSQLTTIEDKETAQ